MPINELKRLFHDEQILISKQQSIIIVIINFLLQQDNILMLLRDNQKNSKQGKEKESSYIKKIDSYDESRSQAQPSMLQYNLQKLLAQSAERQQKYINFIKQQKEQLFSVTQKYAEVMQQYKKEIKQFIIKKQSEKSQKKYEKVHKMITKSPPNKYNKSQYTLQSQFELNCKIKFMYIIPVLQDYLKQIFPTHFFIQFTQYYPTRQTKSFEAQLNPEIDEQQRVQRMKNGYSIQIFTKDMTHVSHSFLLSHFNEKISGFKILKYFKQQQIQFMLKNKQSQLFFGYGNIDLQQFLQFSPQNEQKWVQKIPIMAMQDSNTVIAYIHIQLINSAMPKTTTRQHIHKISQPITLNKQSIKYYNDKQSRIIQRINQYKNSHNSVIPSAGGDSADKNILIHQKRKQLQQIQQYKQIRKNQYMDKVFGQALQQYHTEFLQVGQCKYIPFVYTNHTDRHQKIKIKLTHHVVSDLSSNKSKVESKQVKSELEGTQSISLEIVNPADVQILMQQSIIQYRNKTENCTVNFVIEEDMVFVVNGQSILLFVKVVTHSLLNKQSKYQIFIQIGNDFGQSLHSDMIMLKTYLPVPTHTFPLYTYIGQVNQIKVQAPSFVSNRPESTVVGKSKITNIVGNDLVIEFESNWSENYQILSLKLKTLPKIQLNKTYTFYIFVYDINYTVQLACYQFQIQCMEKNEVQNIEIGRTNLFNLKLRLPPLQGESNAVVQKFMVRLSSSDYSQAYSKLYSTAQKTKQFLVQRNVEHPITLCYNSFQMKPGIEKFIISCIDYSTNKCIKKLVIPIKKNVVTFKHIYRLNCPVGKMLVYNFQLHCNQKQQTTYKLYSSNYSLMTIPQDTIVLFPNQFRSVKLQFRYWQKQVSSQFQTNSNQRTVVLTVDDATTTIYYLFQLQSDGNS